MDLTIAQFWTLPGLVMINYHCSFSFNTLIGHNGSRVTCFGSYFLQKFQGLLYSTAMTGGFPELWSFKYIICLLSSCDLLFPLTLIVLLLHDGMDELITISLFVICKVLLVMDEHNFLFYSLTENNNMQWCHGEIAVFMGIRCNKCFYNIINGNFQMHHWNGPIMAIICCDFFPRKTYNCMRICDICNLWWEHGREGEQAVVRTQLYHRGRLVPTN